jgi:Mn2+/Fe2+ NRAMP family transporter
MMAMMMVIVTNAELMGRFRATPRLVALGWIGTGLMGLAVIALLWSSVAG